MNENSLQTYFKENKVFNTRAEKVYNFIKRNPSLTAEQIRINMGFRDSNNIFPRLTDLKNKGLIKVDGNVLNKYNIKVSTFSITEIDEIKSIKVDNLHKIKQLIKKLSSKEIHELSNYIIDLDVDTSIKECKDIHIKRI